jgi:pimeloyl-ACP methyl ester carboxylesterase
VVCVDLRGYGRSGKPGIGPDGYSTRVMAADVLAVLDHLDVATAAIVGHDRGGLVGFASPSTTRSGSASSA